MTLATVPEYDPERIQETSGRAVVVGGSVAGMLTARVLADRYATVTVIERDQLADESVRRPGVPQGAQPHGLLEGGRATIEDLLPGYCDALLEAGGVEVDTSSDVEFYDDGVELAGTEGERSMLCASRPLFELIGRRQLTAIDGVEFRDGCTFLDYLHDDDRGIVEGIRVSDDSDGPATVEADLVVDATGRTSRTPGWLGEHDYPEPPLDEVHIDVLYGTVRVRRPPDDRRMVFAPASHPHRRGGLVVPVEGDRWIVNLHGFHGDHPPGDVEGVQRFADGLATGAISNLLESVPVLSESVDRYPIPSSRRYRYETLDRFPDGFLVVGDAIASFNPIYAQGMTVAAFEALVLHHALADGDDDLPLRFFEAVAPVVDNAWSLGVGPDFEFPETEGPRPSGSRIAGWYVGRLQRRARHDPVLTEALTRVIQFERPPTSLFRPDIAWRVLSPIRGLFGSSDPAPSGDSDPAGGVTSSSED